MPAIDGDLSTRGSLLSPLIGPDYYDGKTLSDAEKKLPELLLKRQKGSRSAHPLSRQKRERAFRQTALRTTAFIAGGVDGERDSDDKDESLLTDSQRLATSQHTVRNASYAMMFCVLAEGIQEMAVMPNYPLMVTPGAHPDSFASTGPFGVTAAQYVLCAATAIAMMISNLFSGKLADILGQRKMALILTTGAILCNLAKYFAKTSFFAFAALYFVNGLFGGCVAVANSYMSLVFSDDRKKVDNMLGCVTATSIASFSIGGLLTILFPENLFMPLIVAACISFVALVAVAGLVLDPGSLQQRKLQGEENIDLPTELDKVALLTIIFGALMDNIGSLGITPLAFSPVLYQRYLNDFVEAGLPPIMTENNYRLAYTMISVMIVPAASIGTYLFQKIGPAKSCVLANAITGIMITALLFIAKLTPTEATLGEFLALLYIGAPFTFISNVSTGPMLDRITPLDKKGTIHGMNNAVFKFSAAVFQLLLGWLADKYGIFLVLWTCVGVSFFASFSNLPLVCHPLLGTLKTIGDDESTVALDEDEVQRLLDDAEYVSLKDIYELNTTRAEIGLPLIQSRFGQYSRRDAAKFELHTEDLKFLRGILQRRIHILNKHPEMKSLFLQSLSSSLPEQTEMESKKRELEQWISSYLIDAGYFVNPDPQLFKSLFMKSFPRLTDGPDITIEDGLEDFLVNELKLLDQYIEQEAVVSKRALFFLGIKTKTN